MTNNIDWNNKEEVLKELEKNGWTLEFAGKELKRDREVVMVAIKNNGLALEYASERLKDNYDIVLVAVKNNGRALKFASKKLQEDSELIAEAEKQLTGVQQKEEKFKASQRDEDAERTAILEECKGKISLAVGLKILIENLRKNLVLGKGDGEERG